MNVNRKKRRRGYALLELTVAALVLMSAMGSAVKVLGWVASDRRGADRRVWAVQAVSNVLERVSAEPFDRVTAETVKSLADRADASKALPGAAWDVDVEDDRDAPIPARRVSLRLRWKERSGDWGAPVRLSAWVFDRGYKK